MSIEGVQVRSFYTSHDGAEEQAHGPMLTVPALPGETPQDTLARKHAGAQKHGYTVLRFDMGAGILESQKYFDDATVAAGNFYKKRYYFWIGIHSGTGN